jgi:hypothetical protein
MPVDRPTELRLRIFEEAFADVLPYNDSKRAQFDVTELPINSPLFELVTHALFKSVTVKLNALPRHGPTVFDLWLLKNPKALRFTKHIDFRAFIFTDEVGDVFVPESSPFAACPLLRTASISFICVVPPFPQGRNTSPGHVTASLERAHPNLAFTKVSLAYTQMRQSMLFSIIRFLPQAPHLLFELDSLIIQGNSSLAKEHLSSLRSLVLRYCILEPKPALTALQSFYSIFSDLRVLKIVTSHGMGELLHWFPSTLTDLSLHMYDKENGDEGIYEAISSLESLLTLELYSTALEDEGNWPRVFQKLPATLERLSLAFLQLDLADLKNVVLPFLSSRSWLVALQHLSLSSLWEEEEDEAGAARFHNFMREACKPRQIAYSSANFGCSSDSE